MFSRVRLFATAWTVAHQAPLSTGFPRQEHWSGLPFPSPGALPDPGIEPASPALAGGFFTTEPPGNPWVAEDHQHPSGGGRNFQHRRSASHTFFGLRDFSSVLSVLKYVFLFFCFFPTKKHWFWPTFHFLLFLYPGLCSQVPFSNTTYRQWPEFSFSVPPDPSTHPTCLYIRILFLPLLFEDPYCSFGCPQWLNGKEPTCNARRHGFNPWFGNTPWRRAWQPTPVFLSGESSWSEEPGELHGVSKESDVTEATGYASAVHLLLINPQSSLF